MDASMIDTPTDHAIEGQTQAAAEAILATAARVGHAHPRNARMRELARDLVLADMGAVRTWENWGNGVQHDDPDCLAQGLDELVESRQSTRDAVHGLEDSDRWLVLQGLLELHLRMAVQWTADLLDPTAFRAAASTGRYVDLSDMPQTLSDALAYELVAAWHAICFDPGACHSHSSKDRSLRRIWQTADRTLQLDVIFAIADAATQITLARHRQEPQEGLLSKDTTLSSHPTQSGA